jgi:hypothetical protein
MRRIAMGKHILEPLDHHNGPKINGLSWDNILSSMQKTAAG